MIWDRPVRLTAEGKAKLEEELAQLESVKKPELAARIQDATDNGDVADNNEFEALKEEFILTEAKIAELQMTLEKAEIVEPPTSGTVGLGSVVTIRSEDGDETWRLVGPEEADVREGTISTDSPVGRALMDCREGDSATVETPAGAMIFTIVRVARKRNQGTRMDHHLSQFNELQSLRRSKADDLRAVGSIRIPRARTAVIRPPKRFELFDAKRGTLKQHRPRRRVTVAGRVVGQRHMGKTVFAHLRDGHGQIQIYLRKDDLGEEQFDQFLAVDRSQ